MYGDVDPWGEAPAHLRLEGVARVRDRGCDPDQADDSTRQSSSGACGFAETNGRRRSGLRG